MDRGSLTIKRGETGSYRIRLSEPPIADNWWLLIFADGEKRSDGEYEGLIWVPSIGWEFDQNYRDRDDGWRLAHAAGHRF